MTKTTFYRWKKLIAELAISELRSGPRQREENRKRKSLVADLVLDKHMLQEVIEKSSKAVTLARSSSVSAGRLQTRRT